MSTFSLHLKNLQKDAFNPLISKGKKRPVSLKERLFLQKKTKILKLFRFYSGKCCPYSFLFIVERTLNMSSNLLKKVLSV